MMCTLRSWRLSWMARSRRASPLLPLPGEFRADINTKAELPVSYTWTARKLSLAKIRPCMHAGAGLKQPHLTLQCVLSFSYLTQGPAWPRRCAAAGAGASNQWALRQPG